MDNILELKRKVAQGIRTLAGGGILAQTVGHLSCRIPGSQNLLVLGHAHKSFVQLDEITEDDIIMIDPEANVIEGKHEPPGEVYLHTEIYKRRPDVGAIVHGHPEMSTSFANAGRKIIPVHTRSSQFWPEVPNYDNSGQIDTPEIGASVAAAMGKSLAIVLRGHGSIVAGETIEDACVNAFSLETNARMLFYTIQLGTPIPIPESEIRHHKPTSVWRYYVRKHDSQYDKVGYLF